MLLLVLENGAPHECYYSILGKRSGKGFGTLEHKRDIKRFHKRLVRSWPLAIVTAVLVPLVLLMKPSAAEKGEHIGGGPDDV